VFEKLEEGIGQAEMLFQTSLIIISGSGDVPSFSPRQIRLIDSKTLKQHCDLSFSSAVLSIKLNRTRFVVVLENKVHVFDMKSMKMLHKLDIVSNPFGVAALSYSPENCYLAVPASTEKGQVLLYDTKNLQVVDVIHAHESPVRHMAFNSTGTMLATTSHKGTVIRVFSIPDGEKLFSFRRGTFVSTITSLSFNEDSTLLSVSSLQSLTIHVFALSAENRSSQQKDPSTASEMALRFLPVVVQDYVAPSRNFAHVTLKGAVTSCVCGFSGRSTLFVVTSDGFFYRYEVPEAGGLCKLLAEHALHDTPSEEIGVKVHPNGSLEEDAMSNRDQLPTPARPLLIEPLPFQPPSESTPDQRSASHRTSESKHRTQLADALMPTTVGSSQSHDELQDLYSEVQAEVDHIYRASCRRLRIASQTTPNFGDCLRESEIVCEPPNDANESTIDNSPIPARSASVIPPEIGMKSAAARNLMTTKRGKKR